jgi:PAS domain S-box-containing protein
MPTEPAPARTLAFSTRISIWFAGLLIAIIGILFLLWYFGLPQFGLPGTRQSLLAEVTRLLETEADHRAAGIIAGLAERRGNILYATESRTITRQLERGEPQVQASLGLIFDRLQRAYPDHYEKLMIVDPGDGLIRASSAPAELGRPFADPGLIERARQPGMTELVEELPGADGRPTLAIVRQMHALDADESPSARLVGLFVALLDARSLLGDGFQEHVTLLGQAGVAWLYNATGQRLIGAGYRAGDRAGAAPAGAALLAPFPIQGPVVSGYSGTLQQRDAQGHAWVVVYRAIRLGGTQGWTLIYAMRQAEAFAALSGEIHRLALVGLWLTLLALALIGPAARRLTRSLQALAAVAERLGAGDLAARAQPGPRDSREVTVLTQAFNRMASNIQDAQQTLEQRVSERTLELVAAQTQLRCITDTVHDAILMIDPQGCIIYWNPAATTLLGYTAEEALGQNLHRLLAPARYLPAHQAAFPEFTHSGHGAAVGKTIELSARRKDGQEVAVELSLAAVALQDGWNSVGMLRDITERKRMEAALAASEERFRLALEVTSESLWDADILTGDEVVNTQWFAQLGYAPGAVTPTFERWQSHLHPEDAAAVLHAIDDYLNGRSSTYCSEHRIITRSGEVRWHRSLGKVVARAADGTPRRIIGTNADITDQVEALARIREAEGWLRLALEAADIGIWNWDMTTDKLEFDERLCSWYEVPEATRRAGLFYDFWKSRVHPDDLEWSEAKLGEAIRRIVPYEDEFRIVLPGGRVRIIQSAAVIEQDPYGRPRRMLGINRDITAQRELEATLRNAKQAAEVANAAKSDFLAHMSHEIRTPMNAVLGLVQVLEKADLTPDQRTIVQQIRTAGGSLLGIINDVLDLSKIEAGQLSIEVQPMTLPPLLARIGELLGETARRKGITLEVMAPPSLEGRLLADPHRLEQVLINLVGNAIKFTDQGTIQVRVELLASTDQTARLRFAVSDTGIGISPETLTDLFSPFTQADASITRRFGGTGLGLSICKRLVELMGGTIGVASRLGAGSTFWFELPCARTASAAALPPAALIITPASFLGARASGPPAGGTPALPSAAAPDGARLAGLHLLVVDDNQLNLEVVARLLALEGAHSTLAGDGRQALERLRAQPQGFAAVLMDVQMPVMDGLTATRAIRRELGLTALPVIALTAGVLQEEQERAQEAGVDDFLAKPIELEQLVARLTRWARPGTASDADHRSPPSPPAAGAGRAPVPADLPPIPGIAPDRLAQLAQGDGAFLRRLLRGFVADATGVAQQVQADLAQGAPATAAGRLHRLRGAAANLGAADLAHRAGELEEAIRAESPAITELLGVFTASLATLLAALAAWLAEAVPAAAPVGTAGPLAEVKLAALRAALAAHRPGPARRLFAELETSLAQVYGDDTISTLAADLDALRFDEALGLLEDRR